MVAPEARLPRRVRLSGNLLRISSTCSAYTANGTTPTAWKPPLEAAFLYPFVSAFGIDGAVLPARLVGPSGLLVGGLSVRGHMPEGGGAGRCSGRGRWNVPIARGADGRNVAVSTGTGRRRSGGRNVDHLLAREPFRLRSGPWHTRRCCGARTRHVKRFLGGALVFVTW